MKVEDPTVVRVSELCVGDYIIDWRTNGTVRLTQIQCDQDRLPGQAVYTLTFTPNDLKIVTLADTLFAIVLRSREAAQRQRVLLGLERPRA